MFGIPNGIPGKKIKPIFFLINNKLYFLFRLPRPNSQHQQNPPSAGFVVSGVWKARQDEPSEFSFKLPRH